MFSHVIEAWSSYFGLSVQLVGVWLVGMQVVGMHVVGMQLVGGTGSWCAVSGYAASECAVSWCAGSGYVCRSWICL